jgi:hypothetical protein
MKPLATVLDVAVVLGVREHAADVVVSLGAGRCLAAGCSTRLARDGQRSYCSSHTRGPSRRIHDAALAGAAALLEEVDELLSVPRRSR